LPPFCLDTTLAAFVVLPNPNEFTAAGDGLNTAQIRFTRRVEGLDLTNGNGSDVNRDQYNARIDHNFNSKHKLSVIGTKEKTWGAAGQAVQRAWPDAFDGLAVKRPDVYIITFTSTLTQTLFNELRAGRRRSIDLQYPPANRPDAIGQEVLNRIHSIGQVAKELRGLRLADDLPALAVFTTIRCCYCCF